MMAEKLVQLVQSSDTPFQVYRRAKWQYSYGYSRSAESSMSDDIGQDYMTLYEDEESLSFVLCDGVSMSYFGHIAAKFAGDRILRWLREGSHDAEQDMLASHLTQYLAACTQEAGTLLERHIIPDHIQGMLREVLADKKEQGSSTMFACGRIDRPGELYPYGRLLLCWMGDIRIRIWSGQVEHTIQLGDRFHTREQWNSARGPVSGSPHLTAQPLLGDEAVDSLVIYTDGLKVLDRMNSISDRSLADSLEAQSSDPASDDMTCLRVSWKWDEPLVE